MEARKDLQSILSFLPLIIRSSVLFWPPPIVMALKNLSKGPMVSNVHSGELFAVAIASMRDSLGLPDLHSSTSLGFSLFFDELMNRNDAVRWFTDVVPKLADLLLRLPILLETHYHAVDDFKMDTGLRLLYSQQPGLVLLSQELIAALLVCALFCLFPTTNRGFNHLQPINFDNLFRYLYESLNLNQEHKIKCLVHYFEKICSEMPMGNVSYERKVLTLKNNQSDIVYPQPDFWSKSTTSLSRFEVVSSGLIEDQGTEALEVDFANKYIGGGALGRGCVQEEIRFMINPELIVSMLFLPAMEDNEAIEIIGAQRFSSYTGYASSFRFSGDYSDTKSIDTLGRKQTRIIAIDALCFPGEKQYKLEYLLRESSKAFCGFLSSASSSSGIEIGIATGNWGCGAFGGDPQLKAMIQWIAGSESERPFMLYYTFGVKELEKLEGIVKWIRDHEWSVGDLWSVVLEYCGKRLEDETFDDLFKWILPCFHQNDLMILGEESNSSC